MAAVCTCASFSAGIIVCFSLRPEGPHLLLSGLPVGAKHQAEKERKNWASFLKTLVYLLNHITVLLLMTINVAEYGLLEIVVLHGAGKKLIS